MIAGRTEAGVRYAVKRRGSAVAYCSLSIGCGTRSESGFHSGIAHFTEHTLFKGTERKSASVISSYLDKLGGELNAYTTKEEIVLHATVLKEDLQKASALLMEIATMSVFPENEIDTERGVVIDEIKSYKDSPADDVYDRFEEMLFKGHPLAKPILGTASSVKAITSEELKRFVAYGFRPEKMAFTVVADIEESRMKADVIRLCSKFLDGRKNACRPDDVVPALPANHFNEIIRRRNHEANAVIGGYAPSLYEERARMATILMSNILGGPGMNSMLNRILREKNGWVYGVESAYTQYSDTGILAISFGCDKENVTRCSEAIAKAICRLQTVELSERSLKAAKKQLLGQLAIGSDNGEAQCLSMGKSLLAYGRVASQSEIVQSIEAVTAAEIREMACRIFAPESTSSLVLL